MKSTNYYIGFFSLVFLMLFNSVQVLAQGPETPNRERVETLLERVDECKQGLEKEEEQLKMMEADPESVTLAQYNATKRVIEAYNKCLKAVRKELESLRKKYPGWFNSPSASMEVTVHRQVMIIFPYVLLAIIVDMESVYKAFAGRFGNIQEPRN